MKKEKHNSLLTDREKENLKNRILTSAQKEKQQKRALLPFFTAAASFVLLFSLGYYSQYRSEPSIEDYVRSTSEFDLKKAEGVTLILGNNSNINLNEENSQIQYSSSGEQINVGSDRVVNQNSAVDEATAYNTLLVPHGKRTTLQLSDGSKVWLNSGSKLVFPAVFKGNSRTVFLEGEAIFDVVHNTNKPFKVISGSQEIEVLGTVFNVSSYAGDELVETVLKSGSVNITYPSERGKAIKLIPGTMASFNRKNAEISTTKVNVDNYFSWKEGFLTLEKASLTNIMQKLSRFYAVEIIIEDRELASQSFSGKLDLTEDVEAVVELIRQTSNFKIEKFEDKIVILKPVVMRE